VYVAPICHYYVAVFDFDGLMPVQASGAELLCRPDQGSAAQSRMPCRRCPPDRQLPVWWYGPRCWLIYP